VRNEDFVFQLIPDTAILIRSNLAGPEIIGKFFELFLTRPGQSVAKRNHPHKRPPKKKAQQVALASCWAEYAARFYFPDFSSLICFCKFSIAASLARCGTSREKLPTRMKKLLKET
jgi:hypothetical protein